MRWFSDAGVCERVVDVHAHVVPACRQTDRLPGCIEAASLSGSAAPLKLLFWRSPSLTTVLPPSSSLFLVRRLCVTSALVLQVVLEEEQAASLPQLYPPQLCLAHSPGRRCRSIT